MTRILIAAIVAGAGALCAPSLAIAHGYTLGPIEIGHPWTRATPPGAAVAAGYLTLTNTGEEPVRFTGGSTPAAAQVQIHAMTTEDGVMRMRQLPDGIEIEPGETVTFAPGGYHLMLIDPVAPIEEGDRVPLSATFAGLGSIDMDLAAVAIGASPKKPDAGVQGGHHHAAADTGAAKPTDGDAERQDDVTIGDPWMRYVIAERPAGGYFSLRNEGDQSLALVGARSPACGMVHLHESAGGAMRAVDEVRIAGGATARFEPGGYHLMCMKPKMAVGDTIAMTFVFSDGRERTETFEVFGAGGKPQ